MMTKKKKKKWKNRNRIQAGLKFFDALLSLAICFLNDWFSRKAVYILIPIYNLFEDRVHYRRMK